MKKMTYIEQLRSTHWQKRRLECLQAANWTCQRCESSEKTLHVHHKQYFRGRMAWEYNDQELTVLCEDCHEAAHTHQDLLSRLLTNIDAPYPAEVIAIGLLAGHSHAGGNLDVALANEALLVAGPYFQEGVLAYAAALAPAAQLAALIRQTFERYQFDMAPMLEQQLQQWETIEPAKDF